LWLLSSLFPKKVEKEHIDLLPDGLRHLCALTTIPTYVVLLSHLLVDTGPVRSVSVSSQDCNTLPTQTACDDGFGVCSDESPDFVDDVENAQGRRSNGVNVEIYKQ